MNSWSSPGSSRYKNIKAKWTTADEINFLKEIPEICKESMGGMNPIQCYQGYLKTIFIRSFDENAVDVNKCANFARDMINFIRSKK